MITMSFVYAVLVKEPGVEGRFFDPILFYVKKRAMVKCQN